MHLIVQAVGVLIAAAGLVALFAPDLLQRAFRGILSGPWLAVASIGRLALGVAFWLVAPSTLGPLFVRVLGVLMVVAGLALPLLGRKRVEVFVDWWVALPSGATRLFGPLGILLGALVVLAGRPA